VGDARVSVELFSSISSPRASAEVIRQIRNAVEGGHLAPGDRLPPERELANKLGVSRVTVRDALRSLESDGLVTIRVGSGGGAFVSVPKAEHLQRGVDNLLLTSALTASEVTEARLIFELGAVELACHRATEEDIADLEEICADAERANAAGSFDVRLSTAFHVRLARASHNRAVALMTEALQEPIHNSLTQAKRSAPATDAEGLAEHRQLVDAIRSRDVDKARHVLFVHLRRTAQRVRGDGPLPDDVFRQPRAGGAAGDDRGRP
jgi:GntR family transcriptional regulator, transcriptional repressor for pyruvate dehydrogenase complex